MSALTHTTFAIAGGTGNIGAFITAALVAQGARVVRILSRRDIEAPAGTTAIKVDYENKASLVRALTDTEVVVSAVSGVEETKTQFALADGAAKEAGAKLFVPSEFSLRTQDIPAEASTLVADRQQLFQHLTRIGLPCTLYYTGLFVDNLFYPSLGFDIANKHFNIVGPGTVPVSWTTRKDIGHFVAYTLTHLPTSRLASTTLRVEGDKKSLVEIAKIFEGAVGSPFTLTHRDVDAAAENARKNGYRALLDFIFWAVAEGYHDVLTSDNGLVPGFQPAKAKDVIAKDYGKL